MAQTIDQFKTPWLVNMPLSTAVEKTKENTATVPTMPPSSGRISAGRRPETLLTRSSGAADDRAG